jgi:hypothetical protein
VKVREGRGLADREFAKNGGQVDELLAACSGALRRAPPFLQPSPIRKQVRPSRK